MPDEGSPLDKVVTLPGGEALARDLPGWTVLPLGGAARPAFAVLHPASGVALIDAAPDAAEALRGRLEAAGFAGRFGALPPVARIAMGPEDAGLAGERVAAAFTELPPPAFAPDAAWVGAVREVLTDPSFLAVAAPQAITEPGADSAAVPVGRGGGRRLLGVFWGAVGLLVLAGGLLLQLAGPPSAQTEPEAKPGADAPAVPLARVVPGPADKAVAPPPDAPAATDTLPAARPAAEPKDEGRTVVADVTPAVGMRREREEAAEALAAAPAVVEAAQREAEAAGPPTIEPDPAHGGLPGAVGGGSATPAIPVAGAPPAPVKASEEETEALAVEGPTVAQQEATPAPPAEDHVPTSEAHEAASPPAPVGDSVAAPAEPAPATPAATAPDAASAPAAAPADVATPPSPSTTATAEPSSAPATPDTPAAVPDEPASTAAQGGAAPAAAAHEITVADARLAIAGPAPAAASAQEPPEEGGAAGTTTPAASSPQAVASAPPAVPPAVDPPRPPAATVPDSPLVTAMIRRGHEMLANGDVSGARLLFRRAASVGSGEGALALARALDPAALARMGVVGIRGDAAEAAYWYRIAAERGHADARREDAAPRGD